MNQKEEIITMTAVVLGIVSIYLLICLLSLFM